MIAFSLYLYEHRLPRFIFHCSNIHVSMRGFSIDSPLSVFMLHVLTDYKHAMCLMVKNGLVMVVILVLQKSKEHNHFLWKF